MGHELVEFNLPIFEEISLNYLSIMSLMGMRRVLSSSKGEKLAKGYHLKWFIFW